MRVTKWNLDGLINTFNKVISVSKRYKKPVRNLPAAPRDQGDTWANHVGELGHFISF